MSDFWDGRFPFTGTTMPSSWFLSGSCMVPLCIVTIRFGKPKPTLNGIREEVRLTNLVWWWFSVHKFGLMFAVGLSLVGMAVALYASGGFSGSLHSFFGITTITLGCLQVVSGWFRGKHGGRNYFKAVPDDPSTWRGDHYDMTPRRRKFEAYHKTAGYFVFFFVSGALAYWPDAIPDASAGRLRFCRSCLSLLWCALCWSTKDFATTGTARLTATILSTRSTKSANICDDVGRGRLS